jgi:chloramphenicol-sensitive protein RarD
MTARPADRPPASEHTLGLASAFSAYLIWGLLPLFLKALSFASPWEILAQRVLWSIPAAALAVALFGGFRSSLAALRTKGVMPALILSSALIAVNWAIFVWAVDAGRVIEGSLAYFMTPLVNVAIGVLFFGDKLKGLQGVALGLAACGVVLQGVALGAPPWVSLGLAASWAAYGVVRKLAPVPSAGGLLTETLLIAPFAALLLGFLMQQGPLAFEQGPREALLLALLGPATAAPLILFALGARRISFVSLGLLQYVGPSLQLVTGLAFGEAFSALRGASFALIWAGVALFSWEVLATKAKS